MEFLPRGTFYISFISLLLGSICFFLSFEGEECDCKISIVFTF